MDHRKLCLRAGAAAVAFAMAVRLFGSAGFSPLAALRGKEMLALLVWLQTGRLVSLADTAQPTQPPESPPPTEEVPATQPELPQTTQPVVSMQEVFSPADAAQLSVSYGCSHRPELETLLLTPLSWNLKAAEPTVLIVHTHATESYTPAPGETYTVSGNYRTLDANYNMVSIGDEIARVLEAGGIGVIHDRSFHDYPSYNGAYASSRAAVAEYLARYPSIRLVLDIHRDAAGGSGAQLTTSAWVDGEAASQLMLVVGSHTDQAPHAGWQQNLSLALKLHALLQRENPGLCRPVNLRDWPFNQDLMPGSLLVEVGAAGDSHQQALNAARALAEGILALAYGAANGE